MPRVTSAATLKARPEALDETIMRMEMPDASKNNEQIDRAAESANKAAEEATRAGADMARRTAQTTRSNLESGLNSTVQTFKRVTDQFTQVLGFAGPQADEMARRSAQNLEAVSQASTVLTKGAQELSREWFDVMQDRLAKNIDAMNRLAGCRPLQGPPTGQSGITPGRVPPPPPTPPRPCAGLSAGG